MTRRPSMTRRLVPGPAVVTTTRRYLTSVDKCPTLQPSVSPSPPPVPWSTPMTLADQPSTPITLTSRLGGWLPWEPEQLNAWLAKTIAEAENTAKPVHPVVAEFRKMIESDPVMTMNFTLMFQQQPLFPPPPGSGDV